MTGGWTPAHCAACGERECVDTTCCTDCTHRPGSLAYAQMIAERYEDLDDAALEDGMG